jgi:predicted RNase H-like HicB family nuclease
MHSLPIEIEALQEGGYLATSPILPGFLVEGETIEDVLREAPVVARELLQAYRDLGKPLPAALQPITERFSTNIPVVA